MPTPDDILKANFLLTRFPDLTADVKLTTANPARANSKLHVLSKLQLSAGGGTFDVMGRSDAMGDIPYLIHQVLQPPSIDLHILLQGNLRQQAFVPWDPVPRTDLRNADQVLPGTSTGVFAPEGTMPNGPGPVPTVQCWVVDLRFAGGSPGPNLVRMWIEQSLTKALDHRVEQYQGTTLLRVVASDGWAPAGPRWGARARTFIDAQSGASTTLTVENADVSTLDPSIFNHGSFLSGNW